MKLNILSSSAFHCVPSRPTRAGDRRSVVCVVIFSVLLFSACTSTRYETQHEPHTEVASWYGPEFHGKPTASGERFDMYALTCAHRELPFGTVVKVTNVAKGKSVRCTVNDRGPFVAGRDIDLSYATAREIGLTSTGPVTVEYLERDMRYVKEIGYAAGSKGPYTIQVGAFREQDNAVRLKAGLDLKYNDVYITDTVINNATFYRVRIGKFPDKKRAYRLATTLAEEGYSPLVTHYDERI